MNASASALSREQHVQSRIRSIQAFGRNARALCSALFMLGLVVCAVLCLLLMFGGKLEPGSSDGSPYDTLTTPQIPLQFRVLAALILVVSLGVWLAAIRQVQHLFGNLAAGEIYTSGNVRRVRNTGFLWLLSAVLAVALPAAFVLAQRLAESSVPFDADRWFPSPSGMLVSFVSAALVLLVSWVMDVGLYAKEHADALERDAELTI